MALRTTHDPKPIVIADEIWVPHAYFPEPLKSLTPQQVSHRWGRPPKAGPAFPRPQKIADVQYFRYESLKEFIVASAYPERYSVEAMQVTPKAAKPKARSKAK